MSEVVDTAEAAERLGVPASVIRSWQTRKRVTPVGYRRGRGRGGKAPLWLLEELETVAETYQPRPRHADEAGA